MSLSRDEIFETVRCGDLYAGQCWLMRAGLEDEQVNSADGWVGTGRKPIGALAAQADAV